MDKHYTDLINPRGVPIRNDPRNIEKYARMRDKYEDNVTYKKRVNSKNKKPVVENDYMDPTNKRNINVHDIYYDNVGEDAQDFLCARSVHPYSRFQNRIDLTLTNAQFDNCTDRYFYSVTELNVKDNCTLNATACVKSGVLKIPLRAFPDNVNVSAVYIDIAQSYVTYGLRRHQFKMYPNYSKSNLAVNGIEQYILYEPECAIIDYIKWINLETITMRIMDAAGNITFKNPYLTGTITPGVGISTITAENHGLVDVPTPDRVHLNKCSFINRSYPVTVIDDDTFTIPVEINNIDEAEFIIENYVFEYSIITESIKEHEGFSATYRY